MNNIKRVAKNFVLNSDLLSSTVTFRYAGNSDYQSLCMGFVSIITVSAFIAIFVVKLLAVLQLQDITAFEHETDNIESAQPISDIMFAMTVQNLGMSVIDKYFEFTVTQVTLYRPSGSTGAKARTERKIILLPCKMDYWQNMGISDMSTIFSKRGMSAYYCPTQSFSVQGTSDEDTYIYAEIRLTPCNSTASPLCQPNATLQNQYYSNYTTTNEYFTVKLLIRDTIISPTQQVAVSNFLERDILLSFSTSTGTIGYIKIADYQLNTDTNIAPWSQYQTESGYFIQRFQTSTVPSSTKFLYLKLEKSTKKLTVDREYGKIDDLLSYVGGLFGLLFYCIQFFLQSYNEYKYELGVGEVLFNYDSNGNQSKQDDMGFWTYIKYSIYQWSDFFGLQLTRWTSMKQINDTRQQVNNQLDVRYLMNKIRYLQNVAQVLISDQQRTCLFLTELPTISKIQKIRKVAQFYNDQGNDNQQSQIKNQQLIQKTQFSIQNRKQKLQSNSMNISNQEINNKINYDNNAVKQVIQNQRQQQQNQTELENQVVDALQKLVTNQNDPINKKIIRMLRPSVLQKLQKRSRARFPDINNEPIFIEIKRKQKMRKNSV